MSFHFDHWEIDDDDALLERKFRTSSYFHALESKLRHHHREHTRNGANSSNLTQENLRRNSLSGNSLSADHYSQSNKRNVAYLRRMRKVQYNNVCSVILIPSRQEYYDAGLGMDLWISRQDLMYSQRCVMDEVTQVMDYNPALTIELAMAFLYQPRPDPVLLAHQAAAENLRFKNYHADAPGNLSIPSTSFDHLCIDSSEVNPSSSINSNMNDTGSQDSNTNCSSCSADPNEDLLFSGPTVDQPGNEPLNVLIIDRNPQASEELSLTLHHSLRFYGRCDKHSDGQVNRRLRWAVQVKTATSVEVALRLIKQGRLTESQRVTGDAGVEGNSSGFSSSESANSSGGDSASESVSVNEEESAEHQVLGSIKRTVSSVHSIPVAQDHTVEASMIDRDPELLRDLKRLQKTEIDLYSYIPTTDASSKPGDFYQSKELDETAIESSKLSADKSDKSKSTKSSSSSNRNTTAATTITSNASAVESSRLDVICIDESIHDDNSPTPLKTFCSYIRKKFGHAVVIVYIISRDDEQSNKKEYAKLAGCDLIWKKPVTVYIHMLTLLLESYRGHNNTYKNSSVYSAHNIGGFMNTRKVPLATDEESQSSLNSPPKKGRVIYQHYYQEEDEMQLNDVEANTHIMMQW